MTGPRDPDRMIHQFLLEGGEELHDQAYDAVRADIERRRQRVVIGPWRMPDMNKFIPVGLGAAAVVAVIAVGAQLLGSGPAFGPGAGPSASPAVIGGTVGYRDNGSGVTTVVDAVATGGRVSGTAVTSMAAGTHTVRLECSMWDGENWALAGTTEKTTVPGEQAGDWSAVIVRAGSPQRIGVWLSDAKVAGTDCTAWLGQVDIDSIGLEIFHSVEYGSLVPPPASAP